MEAEQLDVHQEAWIRSGVLTHRLGLGWHIARELKQDVSLKWFMVWMYIMKLDVKRTDR